MKDCDSLGKVESRFLTPYETSLYIQKQQTYDDTSIITCFSLIPLSNTSVSDKLVDERVYNNRTHRLRELDKKDKEELKFRQWCPHF